MSGLVLLQKSTITLANFCARNDYEREHVAVATVRWLASSFKSTNMAPRRSSSIFKVILNDVRTKRIMLYVQLELEPITWIDGNTTLANIRMHELEKEIPTTTNS